MSDDHPLGTLPLPAPIMSSNDRYMAPEVLLEVDRPSFASDVSILPVCWCRLLCSCCFVCGLLRMQVWAFGVILGEMFCGASFIKGRQYDNDYSLNQWQEA